MWLKMCGVNMTTFLAISVVIIVHVDARRSTPNTALRTDHQMEKGVLERREWEPAERRGADCYIVQVQPKGAQSSYWDCKRISRMGPSEKDSIFYRNGRPMKCQC
ncbi:uncharacterized protein LOC142348543 [Convolutriloba macropyga]|uniref:uncharacterized protein LOC142348543 n=1 Tax=Convolutriloba macropyga TaxID=536237 RepID=UPI003F52452E